MVDPNGCMHKACRACHFFIVFPVLSLVSNDTSKASPLFTCACSSFPGCGCHRAVDRFRLGQAKNSKKKKKGGELRHAKETRAGTRRTGRRKVKPGRAWRCSSQRLENIVKDEKEKQIGRLSVIVTIYLERGCIERLWKERTGSKGQERASQACKWRWRRNGEGPTFGWAKTEMTKLRKIKKDQAS